jgi:hypothetical protein
MDEFEAGAVEREVHRTLRKTNVHARGEIYYLDAETAIAVIKAVIGNRAAEMVGVERLQSESDLISSGDLAHRDLRSALWTNGERRG